MEREYDKKTVADVAVAGLRVLDRVDFNVPMDKNGQISDDRRIVEALPTIRYLVEHRARVILASHLGRPGGQPNSKYSLKIVAQRVGQLLGQPVGFVGGAVGPEVEAAVQRVKPGQVLMLENLRFYPGEEDNDPTFARSLADLADLYVDDAFGAAHRAHASTFGVAQYLPAVAGFLMYKELRVLGGVLTSPKRPLIAIVGGAKISSKIGVMNNLLPRVDRLLVGGAMANTFLKAQGLCVGRSLVEDEETAVAREILARAGSKLGLPPDVVIAAKPEETALTTVVLVTAVPEDQMILDIGPETVLAFAETFERAGTVVWNGPLGLFEVPKFAEGTLGVARALAKSGAISIVGGGDLVAALEQLGIAQEMNHVSTGGGASLELLEGKTLPGVAVLQDRL